MQRYRLVALLGVGLMAAALRLGALNPLVPLRLIPGAHIDATMPSGRSISV
ncbi:hypothetical protein [Streptomyces sp. NBC_00696]|uniref:hypothetical protein n=1 Tax=Streptomyces sp. NBC_00696 TaxID=2903672 RepID=UPI002E35A82A|nr:hypothetical protein [Streptomyces sp. NBC_00696]